ncbi:MAG: hypothetical protein J0L75_15475 [Spirochaetes bacterium]|nr:hypothetical protein [Spirochaetota bacterium]
MKLMKILLLPCFFIATLSAEAPQALELPSSMRAKQVPFAIGMNRLAGAHEITGAPEAFTGLPALVCDRGDGTKPNPAWSFRLASSAQVYLCVLRRGSTPIGPDWEKTGLLLAWKSKDGAQFRDDIYTKLAPAGMVAIPGHEGKEGATHGVPHLVLLADPKAPLASGGPSAQAAPAKGAAAVQLWIEAENFSLPGGFTKEGDGKATYLQGGIGGQPKEEETAALTLIQVPQAGKYRLWVRSRDSAANQPATRRFAVEVNGARGTIEFGTHRQDGWAWQEGGDFELKAGEATLRILDTTDFFGRCDKILLSSDPGFKPSGSGGGENVVHKPLDFKANSTVDNASLVFTPAAIGTELARLEGGDLRLVFQSFQAGGEACISPAITTRDGKPVARAQDQYFVWLATQESNAFYNARTSHAPFFAIRGILEVGGVKREGRLSVQDPFLSAQVKRYFYGSTLVSKDASRVVLRKECPEFTAEIAWSFVGGFPQADLTVTPKADGFAMLGAYAFPSVTKDETTFFLLPYHWQARRFPESVLLMPAATATAPLALVETTKDGRPWSFAVAANLRDEPMAWLSFENSRFALAIQNERQRLQPGIFAPVPATRAHAVKAGKPVKLSYALYAAPLPWNEGFDRVVGGYFGVRDIRRNWGGTLHDAALNMFDLIMDDKACGWIPKHLGFSQIENKNTVSQSSLLMALEQYWLTGDEAVWDRRALPTAAFLFARHTQHFATHPTDFGLTYVKKVEFEGPVALYGTSTFQGMYEQFRGRAPVFKHDALTPEGGAKLNNGYNSIPLWSEQFYAYKLSGDKAVLAEAVRGAREYIASNLAKVPSNPRSYQPFVKLTIPPYFWAFVDLYEETREPAFLEAAKLAADYLLTTLYVHPYPYQETYKVTRQEALEFTHPQAWWNQETFFRLGFDMGALKADHPPYLVPLSEHLVDPSKIREETVPAWVVSPLGVSIEQPCTIARAKGLSNKMVSEAPLYAIRQNCEVAYLMRLWGLTKEKRYWTYARNGILGQFNNYPGYYINLMSTTERTAEYTLQGPDLSDIYYHHIPVHLAFTVDFLFTSAEMRSGGKVKFPSVLQQGYVWFINRMVGHRPGEFYGVKNAQPLLKRGLIALDTIALNAVCASSPDTFCVFLMNEEETNVGATLTLSDKLLALGKGPVTLIADNGTPKTAAMENGKISVQVSAKGVLAVMARGTTLRDRVFFQPEAKAVSQGKSSFLRETDASAGVRLQVALFAHPIRDQYDAFVNTDLKTGSLTVHWSTDGKKWTKNSVDRFPFETFVRVPNTTAPFHFKVEVKGEDGSVKTSAVRVLRLVE